ncbi:MULTISPECIES: sodium:alanine symporter family protein [unclassified Gemella]|uniref:alanine/glycine:cation symporter family protein n=1 Tax=unclassified Gemella TaxID=2624949 RepID=UPI0015CFB3E8|nr:MULTISPECIES: sodium:alanine symporter family protein [unclassified Gemella]MBF0710716.1 sodium:alanine symporter family protein [Gemella sp. GL1.1]NYS28060.1 sodium:alanine symporter family protein [Gemella sp. GL1]
MYQKILDLIGLANDFMWTYFLIGLILVVGIYFTISTKFIQFTYIKEMFKLILEKPATNKDGSQKGISAFQAFTISAASRVGTGNIAGVAIAIAMGGSGAVFWMWVMALIGGASSFAESTLAQVYKVKDRRGLYRGGPAYYMEKGLGQKWMSAVFAVVIAVTYGFAFNSFQSNTIAKSLTKYSIAPELVGIVLLVITALIIFSGTTRLVKVTQWMVPVMAVIYLLIVFIIMIMNFDKLGGILIQIFRSAFGLEQFAGGTIGMAAAMLLGVKRGMFSNEAGLGSTPNAAATAESTHPAKQGFIQTLGVYFDTCLVCTATAFLILLYPELEFGGELTGIQLTQAAMTAHIGDFGSIFLVISIFLFAYSSVIGNYYYGETNIQYLIPKKWAVNAYRLVVIAFVYLGAVADLEIVLAASDVTMGIMAILNLIAIVGLSGVVYAVLKDYTKQKKAGKDPQFNPENLPIKLNNIECWESKNKIEK